MLLIHESEHVAADQGWYALEHGGYSTPLIFFPNRGHVAMQKWTVRAVDVAARTTSQPWWHRFITARDKLSGTVLLCIPLQELYQLVHMVSIFMGPGPAEATISV